MFLACFIVANFYIVIIIQMRDRKIISLGLWYDDHSLITCAP